MLKILLPVLLVIVMVVVMVVGKWGKDNQSETLIEAEQMNMYSYMFLNGAVSALSATAAAGLLRQQTL